MGMRRAAVAASFLVASGAALAQPYQVLGGAPISLMTDKDIALYEAALKQVLDAGKEGRQASWSNPETGTSGTLEPVRSFAQGQKQCRDVYMETKAKGRHEKGTWPFCKEADGSWKLSPGAAGK